MPISNKENASQESSTPAEYYSFLIQTLHDIAWKNQGFKVVSNDGPIRSVNIEPGGTNCSFTFITIGFNIAEPSNPMAANDDNPFIFQFLESGLKLTYYEANPRRYSTVDVAVQDFKSIEALKAALTPYIENLNLLLSYSGYPDRVLLR
jgi:hypothetical protein